MRSRRSLTKPSKNLNALESGASPMNFISDQGWVAASTDASAAYIHSIASARRRGSTGISTGLFSPR